MDDDLATTYSLIHAFLMKRVHVKAAKALKNSLKTSLVLEDHAIPETSLEDIVGLWKAWRDEDQEEAIIERAKRKDESSDSSSSSESESESETYVQKTKSFDKKATKVDSSGPNTKKKTKYKLSEDDDSSDSESPVLDKVKSTPLKCEPTSSGTLSSNGSKKTRLQHTIISKGKHFASGKFKVANPEHKPDSSSNSDPSSEESDAQPKLIARQPSSSSSSISGKDSDSEPLPKPRSKKSNAVKVSIAKEPASTHLNSNSQAGKDKLFPTSSVQDPKTRVTKKRRMDAEGNSVTTANARIDDTIPTQNLGEKFQTTGKPGNDPRTTSNRFRRVNPAEIQPTVDNSYVSKNAPTNDYGKRAHQDLIVTRGAGFRKEKNKKKRGSYRGGEITMESHSFKFT